MRLQIDLFSEKNWFSFVFFPFLKNNISISIMSFWNAFILSVYIKAIQYNASFFTYTNCRMPTANFN